MVSLTTVYIVSVILTSIAGIGSAFAGNKVTGGAVLESSLEQPKEETVPEEEPVDPMKLSDAIKKGFGMDDEFAENVVMFIKTPVDEWNEIASDQSELRRKFMRTLTHQNLNRCPENLKRVCNLVSVKYSNMKDLIEGRSYQNYGDQTEEAIRLLSNTA